MNITSLHQQQSHNNQHQSALFPLLATGNQLAPVTTLQQLQAQLLIQNQVVKSFIKYYPLAI